MAVPSSSTCLHASPTFWSIPAPPPWLVICSDLKPFSHSCSFLCSELPSFVMLLPVPFRPGWPLPLLAHTPGQLSRLLCAYGCLCANYKKASTPLQDALSNFPLLEHKHVSLGCSPMSGTLLGACPPSCTVTLDDPELWLLWTIGVPSALSVWPEQALTAI